jgi:hypothetical protein
MTTKNKLARYRSQRKRRGAAMAEAIVAFPVFIVTFAMAIFLGRLYTEKLRTMREAKQCAWMSAMTGCEGGCGASVSMLGDANLDMSAEMNPSAGHPQVDDWLRGRPFKEAVQTVNGSASADGVNGGGVSFAGWTVNVSSTSSVQCNEKPEDGRWREIFLYTYHKNTPW